MSRVPAVAPEAVISAHAMGTAAHALANGVLVMAVRDMMSDGMALRHERDQARAFLTAETGDWAKAREAWCDLAGTDAAFVRERALQLLAREGAALHATTAMLKGVGGRKPQRRALGRGAAR